MMASGIARRGLWVSSPIVDAASKPANDRKPNVRLKNSAEKPTPCGSVNTLSVKLWCCGAEPAISLTKITIATSEISVTVTPSTETSMRVLSLASLAASTQMTAKATMENGTQPAPFQIPVSMQNCCMNSPKPATDVAV